MKLNPVCSQSTLHVDYRIALQVRKCLRQTTVLHAQQGYIGRANSVVHAVAEAAIKGFLADEFQGLGKSS